MKLFVFALLLVFSPGFECYKSTGLRKSKTQGVNGGHMFFDTETGEFRRLPVSRDRDVDDKVHVDKESTELPEQQDDDLPVESRSGSSWRDLRAKKILKRRKKYKKLRPSARHSGERDEEVVTRLRQQKVRYRPSESIRHRPFSETSRGKTLAGDEKKEEKRGHSADEKEAGRTDYQHFKSAEDVLLTSPNHNTFYVQDYFPKPKKTPAAISYDYTIGDTEDSGSGGLLPKHHSAGSPVRTHPAKGPDYPGMYFPPENGISQSPFRYDFTIGNDQTPKNALINFYKGPDGRQSPRATTPKAYVPTTTRPQTTTKRYSRTTVRTTQPTSTSAPRRYTSSRPRPHTTAKVATKGRKFPHFPSIEAVEGNSLGPLIREKVDDRHRPPAFPHFAPTRQPSLGEAVTEAFYATTKQPRFIEERKLVHATTRMPVYVSTESYRRKQSTTTLPSYRTDRYSAAAHTTAGSRPAYRARPAKKDADSSGLGYFADWGKKIEDGLTTLRHHEPVTTARPKIKPPKVTTTAASTASGPRQQYQQVNYRPPIEAYPDMYGAGAGGASEVATGRLSSHPVQPHQLAVLPRHYPDYYEDYSEAGYYDERRHNYVEGGYPPHRRDKRKKIHEKPYSPAITFLSGPHNSRERPVKQKKKAAAPTTPSSTQRFIRRTTEAPYTMTTVVPYVVTSAAPPWQQKQQHNLAYVASQGVVRATAAPRYVAVTPAAMVPWQGSGSVRHAAKWQQAEGRGVLPPEVRRAVDNYRYNERQGLVYNQDRLNYLYYRNQMDREDTEGWQSDQRRWYSQPPGREMDEAGLLPATRPKRRPSLRLAKPASRLASSQEGRAASKERPSSLEKQKEEEEEVEKTLTEEHGGYAVNVYNGDGKGYSLVDGRVGPPAEYGSLTTDSQGRYRLQGKRRRKNRPRRLHREPREKLPFLQK